MVRIGCVVVFGIPYEIAVSMAFGIIEPGRGPLYGRISDKALHHGIEWVLFVVGEWQHTKTADAYMLFGDRQLLSTNLAVSGKK